MSIREKLESIFDELRAVGNDIPLSNRQCAILLVAGLNTLDLGAVVDELLPSDSVDEDDDDDVFAADQRYDKMSDDCTTSIDGITGDLQAVIDDWDEEE